MDETSQQNGTLGGNGGSPRKEVAVFQKSLRVAVLLAAGGFIILIVVSASGTVYADEPTPLHSDVQCVLCHEDLYFLHDTGNWFCLKESPMTCVDCHGGNPNTLDKNLAHAQRSAHPILNEDVSKCRQCHPEECNERVAYFDRTAGISEVKFAAPYTPIAPMESDTTKFPEPQAGGLLAVWEIIPLSVITGLALLTHILLRRRNKPS